MPNATIYTLPHGRALTGEERIVMGQDGEAQTTSPDELVTFLGVLLSSGGGGSFHYVQSVPSASWVIVHNLGRYPAIITVDSSGREVYGDIQHNSSNQVTVSFSAAFSGIADCN